MARLLVFATWRLAQLQRLTSSIDPVLAAIAAKGVKEVTYHRDYAAQWVVRLGDGTELSHERSEEHTSELQSRENLVCRLLLGKKTDAATDRQRDTPK